RGQDARDRLRGVGAPGWEEIENDLRITLPRSVRAPAGVGAPRRRSQGAGSYHHVAPGRGERQTEDFDVVLDGLGGRAEVDEQHLVLGMVDSGAQTGLELDDFAAVEFTDEHTVLYVVAEVEKSFVNPCATLVVADVIRDQHVVTVRGARHRVTSP